MPDALLIAIVSSLITGAIALAGGLWLGRRRWEPKQHEIVSRFLAESNVALDAIGEFDVSRADAAIDSCAAIHAEGESILPADLLLACGLLIVALDEALGAVRQAQRPAGLGQVKDAEQLDREAAGAWREARREREAIVDNVRKHFGADRRRV